LEDSDIIRSLGIDAYVERKMKDYSCNRCGGMLYFYHYKCSKCGKQQLPTTV
jgi:uncharacterized OB-fold protein